MQKLHVGPAAGAKWLHGKRMAAPLPQMMKQQPGQQRLADASVGARDENNT